ncbi:MAG: Rieske 2Fe-2S domain-containing protein [Halobacteria archaeon]
MAEFRRVAAVSEIPPGKGKTVAVGAKKIALFNVEGKFYAIDNACLHRGGPLGEGECGGKVVTCPWHGWEWDVTTGANTANPSVKVATYPVKVQGQEIQVQI